MKPWTCFRKALPFLFGFALLFFQPGNAISASNVDANVPKTPANQKPAPPKSAQLNEPRTNRTLTQANVTVEMGRQNVLRYGCPVCHGADLKGGLPNENAQGGEVLSLVHLPDDYTKDEVIAIIRNGKKPPLQDPKKLAPPLYMPEWKRFINDQHIHSIVDYLWTQEQKSAGENW